MELFSSNYCTIQKSIVYLYQKVNQIITIKILNIMATTKLRISEMKVKALIEYLMFCEAAKEVPRKDVTLLMFACEDYNTLVQIFETHKKAHDQFIKKK